jgi:hypothetical protein
MDWHMLLMLEFFICSTTTVCGNTRVLVITTGLPTFFAQWIARLRVTINNDLRSALYYCKHRF